MVLSWKTGKLFPDSTDNVTSFDQLWKAPESSTKERRESILLKYREPVFEERRNHISQACKRLNREPAFGQNLSNVFRLLAIAKEHKIIYCGIPKTGSTFWRKTLTIIENGRNFSSLYEYRNSVTRMQKPILKANQLFKSEVTAFQSFSKDAMSFMFVREPYGRIFSAYNNKILNPNWLFWKWFGRFVVRKVRKNASDESLKYGHDVTFPELIKYLVMKFEHDQGVDQHFSPMFKKCDPCKLKYDYVGKMESFADDAHFLIAKLRASYKDVYIDFGDFDTESALDTAQGQVRFLFEVLKATKKLNYPKYNFFLRTWRDLQIRGYLSKDIEMPMTKEQVPDMTQEDFFDLIKHALQQPMNKTAVRMQRQDAMVQAYNMVPLEDMERLKKYVEMDCLLFGYDIRPDELFKRDSETSDDKFNYFDSI